ncbi:sulfotransferase family protein [Haliea sp. E17]|uniref:sulfotransferase family protein n=1 Tax=Haliea sp. E17 TaxID=3401576 RepID=UPI003AAC3B1D
MFTACPSVDSLLNMASERTGLSDFGDPARHAGLRAYMEAVQAERWPAMREDARGPAIDYFVHLLSLRLQLVEDRKRFPEIAAQEIRAPIIVIGPPRSGSTLLHTLLNQDSWNNAVEHWVCLEPSPPPAIGAPSAERMQRAQQRLMGLFDPIPDIFVTHPYMIEEGASALAECGSDILNMTFTSQQLYCFYRSESYRRYLLEADHSAALGFHHDFLQHLQWGSTGRRWALKGSDHLLWLEELVVQYPDAMLVWTHRDLSEQLPSLTSVQAILQGIAGTAPQGEERMAFGRIAVEHQCATLLKGMRARDKLGDARFIDVSYHDLMANPVATVERIYGHFGLAMSAQHAAGIRAWLEHNPQTKHGVHRHSPGDYGIEGDAINRVLAPYVERFGFGFGIRPELAA